MGQDESGEQTAALTGLTEVLLDPVKQMGMGILAASWLVEIYDASTAEKSENVTRPFLYSIRLQLTIKHKGLHFQL